MTTPTNKIFITGSTGDVGTQLLNTLLTSSIPVRVSCRRQTQVDNFTRRFTTDPSTAATDSDATLCNLDDPIPSLALKMKGCSTLFLLTAATPNQLQQNTSAISAALEAGINWIVRISAADARDDCNVPWVLAHAAADRYLEAECDRRGVKWTIISPSAFMTNLLSEADAIKKGFLPQTCGEGKAGWIDSSDVAAVSAQVLKDGPGKHHAQTHILTGPALLSMPEIASIFTRTLGHKVRYLHLPGPVFGLLLRATGMDAWMANGLVAQFVEVVRPGLEGIEIQDSMERITGRKPVSFEEFVRGKRDVFEGFDVLPYLGAGVVGLGAVVAYGVLQFR